MLLIEAGDEKNNEPDNKDDGEGDSVRIGELLIKCTAIADCECKKKDAAGKKQGTQSPSLGSGRFLP